MGVESLPGRGGENASLESLGRRWFGDLESKAFRYAEAHIPIQVINVLPQPRRTFEEIPELARDIADKGLIYPLIVARFNREDAERYLEVINKLWGTEFKAEGLKSQPEEEGEFIHILIAGERRLRAIQFIEEQGCGRHGEKGCLEEHFPEGKVKASLALEISPIQAAHLQFSENTHMRIPPHEEARALHQLFLLVKMADEKYPLAKFAREVGRSEETVRNALKFSGLPLAIQEAVENGYLPYGKAVEIARLQQAGLSEGELDGWKKRAMAGRQTVDEFRRIVTNHLRDLTSGQTMLELFTEEQLKAMERALTRRVVAKEVIDTLWQRIAYLRTVIRLIRDGQLGEDDSPFSIKSPVRIYRAFVGQLEETLPLLREHLPEKKVEEAEEVIRQASAALAALEAELPEDTETLDPYLAALSGGQENNQ